MKISIDVTKPIANEAVKKGLSFVGGYLGARIVTKALKNVVPVPDKMMQKILYTGGLMVVEGYLGKVLQDYIYEELHSGN